MKKIATLLAGSALAAAALTAPTLTAPAQAAAFSPAPCVAGTVTPVGGTYLGCAGGFTGNDSNQQTAVMAALQSLSTSLGLPNGWTYDSDHKSDVSGNGLFTSNPGGTSGTLTFDGPMQQIFAIALKAGNFYSLYVFDGGITGITSITYNTLGVAQKPNGASPGLSHASYYAVPEPLTLLGTAAALGLGAVMRRRTEEA